MSDYDRTSAKSGARSGGAGGAHAEYTPRERLRAMLVRAYIDEDYANSLKANPQAALQQVGLAEPVSRELLTAPRADSAATVLARGQCFDTTCLVSLCPASCVASIVGIPGVCDTDPGIIPDWLGGF